jgi:hypothetical protein
MSDRLEKILMGICIALCILEAILYAIQAYINYQQCPTCY